MNNWGRVLINRLEFDGERQLFFLTRVSAMSHAGIALRSIFESLARFPSNPVERKLSFHALSNISKGRPFAEGYDIFGWFDKRITALLVAGEEHHCLDETFKALVHRNQDVPSFWKTVVLSNIRWLLGLLVALIICTVLHTQRQLYTQVLGELNHIGQTIVFGIGMVIWEYGFILLFCLLLWSIGVYWALYRHVGNSRDYYDQYGIHRLFRRQFALRLLPEIAGLMRAGLSSVEAVELCRKIYPTGYYHYRLLALSKSIATGTELIEALCKCLLEPRYFGLARSLSAAHPGKPQHVLLALRKIIVADVSGKYRALSRRLSFVAMVSLLGIIYGILEVLYASPANFQSSI